MDLGALFSDFTFKDWFSIIFGVVVAIGMYLYQKYSTRETERNNKILSDFVSIFKEKDLTEKSLEELKQQQLNLKKEIEEHIPELARQSILKEKLEFHSETVDFHYREWDKIRKELDNNSSKLNLGKEIENKIVELITPKYEIAKSLDDLKTKITFSSIIVAITSTFVVSPLDSIIAIPFLFFIFKSLFNYLKLKGISESFFKDDFKFFYNLIYFMIIGLIIIVMFFCGVFIFKLFLEENTMYLVFIGLFIVFFLLEVFIMRIKDEILLKLEKTIRNVFKIVE